MGAIAGLWRLDGRAAGEPLERMLEALRPYGPDAAGRWSQDDVALGVRVMHLFPGDLSDRQPLTGGGGRFAMVADVRLDNRDELAAALGKDSGFARPIADAQLVLHAFERWGEGCLDRLYGDYAFALWDRERRRWLLARDGMGGRPLCYYRDRRLFAFASMPRGLHALPEIPYAADEDLLARALDLVPQDPHSTCFVNISRVAMGECVVVDAAGATSRLHWNPAPEPLRLPRARDYEEAMRAEIDRAVRVRLPASGPVAAHLSAGLDSGSVAATAARLQAETGAQVVAFTAVPRDTATTGCPPGRLLDEGPLAAATASLYGNIEHVRVGTEGRSPLDALGWVFELCEQPILNLCNQVWRDAIYELAQSRGLSVLLTGQAGNLTLSYKTYCPLRERLRDGGWSGLIDEVGAFSRRAGDIGPRLVEAIATRARAAPQQIGPSLMNRQRRDELGASTETLMTQRSQDTRSERLAALQRVDVAYYTKGALARWRIDERDPTADRRLVEFCLAVPDAQFMLGGISASLARRAMADRLPRRVLRERARGLQAADWHAGFSDPKRELAREVGRLSACPETNRMLDIAAMQAMIDDWPTSGWHQAAIAGRYRHHLLRALSNGDFLRRAAAARNEREAGG